MLGDDITVDFTAAWGCEITSGGHTAYSNIQQEKTVAAPTVQKVQTLEWPASQTAAGQTAAAFYRIPATSKLADAAAEEEDPAALFIRASLRVIPAGGVGSRDCRARSREDRARGTLTRGEK